VSFFCSQIFTDSLREFCFFSGTRAHNGSKDTDHFFFSFSLSHSLYFLFLFCTFFNFTLDHFFTIYPPKHCSWAHVLSRLYTKVNELFSSFFFVTLFFERIAELLREICLTLTRIYGKLIFWERNFLLLSESSSKLKKREISQLWASLRSKKIIFEWNEWMKLKVNTWRCCVSELWSFFFFFIAVAEGNINWLFMRAFWN
jgi:hypothetical protein